MTKTSKKNKNTNKNNTKSTTKNSINNKNKNKNKRSSLSDATPDKDRKLKFSAVLDDEAASVQALMGSTVRDVVWDTTAGAMRFKKAVAESRFSELLAATNALPLATSPDAYVVAVRNVVATADTRCTPDLTRFHSKAPRTAATATAAATVPVAGATLRGSVVYINTRMPCARLALFGSGRVMCSGAHSVEDAKFAIKKVVRMLRRAGFGAKFAGFEVVTTVSHLDTKFVIDIESLYERHKDFCTVNGNHYNH